MKLKPETVALVTGASRGIGVHIVRALSAHGCKLVLAARNLEGLKQTARIAEDAGCSVLVVPTDLSEQASIEALVAAAETEFGRIDLLVNNAGVEGNYFFEEASPELIEWTTRVNVVAPLVLSRLVLPGMLERGRGHIVNISSLAGLGPVAFGEVYGASKHAIMGFTSALRASLQTRGSSVSASAICPGYVSEVGMFADKLVAVPTAKAPAFLGVSPPEKVAAAVIKVTEKNIPTMIINPGAMRITLALALLFPRLGEWLGHRLGVHFSGHEAAKAERQLQSPEAPERS